MSEKKQWVQHVSGQGEKWLVVYGGDPIDWMVLCKATDGERNRALPKSKYRLCDPPEVWRDVSEGTRVGSDLSCILYDNLGREISVYNGYRLRKVELHPLNTLVGKQWAFVVEQKVSQ